MKKQLLSRYALIFCTFLYLLACSKTNQLEDVFPEQINFDSLLHNQHLVKTPSGVSNLQCDNGPRYSDSLIYNESGSGKDYIVKPTNNPGEGRYYSWPRGLILDSVNGAINVSKSESGLRYLLGFIKKGTNDTCFQTLILAGAAYVDSIYVLDKNQTLAKAYFDANAQSNSICVVAPGEDDDNGSNGNDNCKFQSSSKKVKVRNITGAIDLKKTLDNNAFGRNPANGTAIKVTVSYQLKDKSNKSSQKLDVLMVYYESKSQIPQEVVDYIQQKRSAIFNQLVIGLKANPRPPLIVITRS